MGQQFDDIPVGRFWVHAVTRLVDGERQLVGYVVLNELGVQIGGPIHTLDDAIGLATVFERTQLLADALEHKLSEAESISESQMDVSNDIYNGPK